jgi:hypothetical protein
MVQIKIVLVTLALLFLVGCSNSMAILEGATHACGAVHIEGYFTDTQGEVIVAKAPDNWTPEQVQEFCSATGA